MEGAIEAGHNALVEEVIAGNRKAFDRLVQQQIPRLLALATRMLGSTAEAEDAVQNALASTWLARHRLSPDKPITALLTTSTLNKCRDRMRRRKAARFLGFGADFDQDHAADPAPGPEAIALDRQALSRVRAEIERLPIRLREALVLVALDGRSHREAGTLLGVTEKTIETRIYRARKRIRDRLGIS
ncbi:RNA polymerase [Croceicoccus estronivorus]|uniref:RNA polymerase sigma factor n=1 Tax=Croceicoccus estronivorus TaxID=1172626 RepID=UPI0008356B1F|nr:RNA polymerase sigma factor [Croceicoccus estronivorus]OCC22949.1 RNA polymerase [Croceicoccus estronivorus]